MGSRAGQVRAAVGSIADLAALADPTRALIVRLILRSHDGRRLVGSLAEELELRQPTISHHVKRLVDDGLLDRTPEGRRVWYSVSDSRGESISQLLAGSGAVNADPMVLERISTDLASRFDGVFARATVARYVQDSHVLLSGVGNPPRPSRTAQFAAHRLAALAQDGSGSAVPEVLFVCVQNAGRSQLAAGILRHLAGDRVHVRTAGSAPAAAVRSVIVAALDEIGVPLGGEYPKPLTDEVVQAADVVVTMGCGDACPVYPGRRYLDWDLDDPVGLPLARVREIRDDIEARVRLLIEELDVSPHHARVTEA